jgi:hypothetical protein
VVPKGDKVLETLQRKANILSEIYEMSKALGAGFDLDRIFKMATDIIFRSTPADRVIACWLTASSLKQTPMTPSCSRLRRARAMKSWKAHARKMTIGRTITRKVMKDRVALLSQDALPMNNLPVSIRLSRRACARPFAPRSLPNQESMERSMRIASILSRLSSPTIWN